MRHHSQLSAGAPRRLALLIDASTQWGREVLTGINAYAREQGLWELLVLHQGIEEKMPVPGRWRGDGIIARVSSNQLANSLRALRLPVVNVSGISLRADPFPRVTNDLRAAATLACRHFQERGFQHFGYFSLLAGSYVTLQQASFLTAVQSTGGTYAAFDPRLGSRKSAGWTSAGTRLSGWLRKLPKPVAILTWNAGEAREILAACRHENLRVPEEVAVLSGTYDDLLCELSKIPISGIRVEAQQIGYQAAACMHRLLLTRKPSSSFHCSIPPTRVVARLSTDTFSVDDPAVLRTLVFFRTHLSDGVKVSDAAKHSGISRRMLERRFQQALRRSPGEELRRLRMERAQNLLAETELSLPEVALAVGFENQAHFGAQFLKHSGQTPRKFRLNRKTSKTSATRFPPFDAVL